MSGGVLSRWLFACAGLLWAPWALGQNVTAATSFYTPGAYTQMPYYGYGGFGGGGYGWGGFNGIGSTPQGSYLGGMSQVIRSQGQYNLMSSQAAVNLQEAQKKNIENQVQWTNAYIEMRRMRDAYRAETKVPPPTAEAWARNAHAAAPDRLPSSSLDPVTGALQWPALLQGEDFAPEREQIDVLMAQRATSHGAIGKDNYAKIRAAVDRAMTKLKKHVRDVGAKEYAQSRNFLTSLGYEASFPAG